MLGKGERRAIAGTTVFYKMFNYLCPKAPRSSSGLSQLHNLAHTAEEDWREILLEGKKHKIIASSRRVRTRWQSSSQIQEHTKQYRKTNPEKKRWSSRKGGQDHLVVGSSNWCWWGSWMMAAWHCRGANPRALQADLTSLDRRPSGQQRPWGPPRGWDPAHVCPYGWPVPSVWLNQQATIACYFNTVYPALRVFASAAVWVDTGWQPQNHSWNAKGKFILLPH